MGGGVGRRVVGVFCGVWVEGYDVGGSGVEDCDFHVPKDGCTFDEMSWYGSALGEEHSEELDVVPGVEWWSRRGIKRVPVEDLVDSNPESEAGVSYFCVKEVEGEGVVEAVSIPCGLVEEDLFGVCEDGFGEGGVQVSPVGVHASIVGLVFVAGNSLGVGNWGRDLAGG